MSTELTLLAWTIVLGLFQVIATAQFSTAQNGFAYGAGPRDTPPKPLTGIGARFERATKNLGETFPFAAAAILIAAVAGRQNGLTWWGANLYFWGRVVYLPLYVAGTPYIRTVVWLVSVLGILLVLFGATRG